MFYQQTLSIATRGRGSYNITQEVVAAVASAAITTGLCNVYVQHTSASVILCENADPTVRDDLESFMGRLVPDGDSIFRHTAEGEDDMPAHIRTILTQSSLTIPVSHGHCALGTWQGVYLWEHRTHPNRRKVLVTVQGE